MRNLVSRIKFKVQDEVYEELVRKVHTDSCLEVRTIVSNRAHDEINENIAYKIRSGR